MHWLRVFGNAEASRMGQGVGQQRHTREVQSEKWWDSVTAYGAGMRVIAVTTTHTAERLTQADVVIADLSELATVLDERLAA